MAIEGDTGGETLRIRWGAAPKHVADSSDEVPGYANLLDPHLRRQSSQILKDTIFHNVMLGRPPLSLHRDNPLRTPAETITAFTKIAYARS